MPTLIDHTIIVILVIALPAYAAISLSEETKQALRESGSMRVKEYWKTSAIQWLLVAGTLTAWFLQGRDAAGIGFALHSGWRFWLGAGICAALIVLLVLQQKAAMKDEASHAALRETIESMAPFLPRTRGEFGHFAFIAITAGICEEILYRGFLYWYLSSFIGTTVWAYTAIVPFGAVIFAGAHYYQGRNGMIQVFAVALIMGGIYLLTEALWVPMLAHTIVDLNGGAMGLRVLRNVENDAKEGA